MYLVFNDDFKTICEVVSSGPVRVSVDFVLQFQIRRAVYSNQDIRGNIFVFNLRDTFILVAFRNYLGALTPYKLTNDELNEYMPIDDMRKDAKVRLITDAYILRVENDNFYLVFQTNDGKTYLAYGWEDVGERGQAGSDDTRLRRLYLLDSSFHSGYVNVNFFERSLINTVGNYIYSFAHFESDKIPGYHITGFKSGDSNNHIEMNDLGFVVFQTTGEGYRLIDCKVYENAALVENGIFFCSDPAVADVKGEMRNDNTSVTDG